LVRRWNLRIKQKRRSGRRERQPNRRDVFIQSKPEA